MVAVIESIRSKRLVFTVTTGRSGTQYLARLFRWVPGVDAHHEPPPRFSDLLRAVQSDPERARAFWLEKKLPRIAASKANVYVETSHVVCKGFLEPLMELGATPDLILLRRPDREVAKSLYRLKGVPGRTEKGRGFLLSPDDPGVLPLPGWRSLHDYQLCFWYCLEIERRRAVYGEAVRAAGGRVVEVALSDLTDADGFPRLLEALGLPRLSGLARWRTLWSRRRKVNAKRRRSQPLAEDLEDLEALEDAVLRLTGPSSASVAG